MGIPELDQIYLDRITDPACYATPDPQTKSNLEAAVHTYGLEQAEVVGSAVLCFINDGQGGAVCQPWMIAPEWAGQEDNFKGRHSYAINEFEELAAQRNLTGFTGEPFNRHDDIWRVNTLPQDDPARLAVFCENSDILFQKPLHVQALRDMSTLFPDHQIYFPFSSELFLCMQQGVEATDAYQDTRLPIHTFADPTNLYEVMLETRSYVDAGANNGLSQAEIVVLAQRAVDAFRNGQQHSLVGLCQEIIAER